MFFIFNCVFIFCSIPFWIPTFILIIFLCSEEPFVFRQVILPDLAVLRIAAYEESGSKFIGQLQGRRTIIGQGEEKLFLRNFFPFLGMIFAPLWAYFLIFLVISLRWPSLQGEGGYSPTQFYAYGQ